MRLLACAQAALWRAPALWRLGALFEPFLAVLQPRNAAGSPRLRRDERTGAPSSDFREKSCSFLDFLSILPIYMTFRFFWLNKNTQITLHLFVDMFNTTSYIIYRMIRYNLV